MTIRNLTNITSVGLAVAVIALASPTAHSQGRINSGSGRILNMTSGMARQVQATNGANYYGANGVTYYGNGFTFTGNNYGSYGDFSGNNPYTYGVNPYFIDNGAPYRNQGGALVLGSDGQLYNPFLGDGAVEPTLNGDGITIPAPVGQENVVQKPAQMSDQIEATRLPGNLVRIQWAGDPRPIASMKFELLDRKRNELRQAVVNDLPAVATFSRPSTAAYYRVTIQYGDGAVRSIVSPL
jgi:hypothetical protein